MKMYRPTLQKYFSEQLPDARALADALTFHAFEIERVENDVLDVKVTANRGHDCLCHRGIAKELSAILEVPMKEDPLRQERPKLLRTPNVTISIAEPSLCSRYIAGYVRGVEVGPSPEWLRVELEAIGQRSINNVVDATNYVMFTLGQPLHTFDAGMLSQKSGAYAIAVRKARRGEKMLALDNKEYLLADSMLVITDAHDDVPIGIAGVKGGAPASISESTTDIIIESANFDGVSVRRTAQGLKLRTDASSRFEQVLSPELAAYGMHAVAALILEVAGGQIDGFVEEYPQREVSREVSVTVERIRRVLGVELSQAEIEDALKRLDLPHAVSGDMISVTVPFERLDLNIAEDLIEEVGRIIGYDAIPATEIAMADTAPHINQNFATAEKKREELMSQGYSEVFTSVFADEGDRAVLNKVGGERPYLRKTLVDGLQEAFERNSRNKELLGLSTVSLFEIGSVWWGGEEVTMVGTADAQGIREEPLRVSSLDRYEEFPVSTTERYQPFSRYPFVSRDIALWVSAGTTSDEVLATIRSHAGELLVRSDKFDEFKKGERTSYAFRLVFQSFDKTLTDAEANERMESVYAAVKEMGWEVR
jgi:phenylalanyl-tRNA synthetase beta chain